MTAEHGFEELIVLYTVAGVNAALPNAVSMRRESGGKGKEVLLIDVLASLPPMLGTQYAFWASLRADRTSFVWLRSPTSVVPVVDNVFVHLHLEPACTSPWSPLQQAVAYRGSSRAVLYSSKHCVAAEAQESQQQRPQNGGRRGRALFANRQPRPQAQETHPAPPPVVVESSSPFIAFSAADASSDGATFDPFNLARDLDEPPQAPRPSPAPANPGNAKSGNDNPRRQEAPPSLPFSSSFSSSSSSSSSSSTATDIAEATTQAAKSIFSFAAKSLKTAAAAGTAAVNSRGDLREMGAVAAGLFGSAGVGAAVTSVQKIGNTKVRVVRELAQGGFGTVYVVEDAEDGGGHRQYALKQMLCQTREQLDDAQNELRALQRFAGHDHIVALVDHCTTHAPGKPASHKMVHMLFPLCPLGTCWDVVERSIGIGSADTAAGDRWPFDERRALRVCLGVAQALDFMHDGGRGFAHRDVKPHNVLLYDADHAVLTDLGSVSPARVTVATRQQALAVEDEAACKTSAAYRAPELSQAPQPPCVVDERVDVWGLGCTLFSLAFGTSPFESPREGVLRLAILNGRFTFPAHYRHRDCQFSDAFADLISAMLKLNASDRPTAAEVAAQCEQMLMDR